MLHIPPTNLLLLTAKQELYKKAYLLTKNIEEFFWKKLRMDQQKEKDKTEGVTGPGRRAREETAKWNQMTALRFQTGGRHQTSPASLQGTISTNTAKSITRKQHKINLGAQGNTVAHLIITYVAQFISNAIQHLCKQVHTAF